MRTPGIEGKEGARSSLNWTTNVEKKGAGSGEGIEGGDRDTVLASERMGKGPEYIIPSRGNSRQAENGSTPVLARGASCRGKDQRESQLVVIKRERRCSIQEGRNR